MHWKWWLFATLIIAVLVYIAYENFGENFGFWPSLGFFSLVIAVGLYLYRQDSRDLAAIMKPLAAQYGGTFRAATMMNFPQLLFEAKGRRFSVQAMPNAGAHAPSGPFTIVQLILRFDSARQGEISGTPALLRVATAALARERRVLRADAAFDKAFRVTGRDRRALADLLNDDLRSRLMFSRLAGLRLRLAGNEITLFIDGLAKTGTEIEEMIALAGALADRCSIGSSNIQPQR